MECNYVRAQMPYKSNLFRDNLSQIYSTLLKTIIFTKNIGLLIFNPYEVISECDQGPFRHQSRGTVKYRLYSKLLFRIRKLFFRPKMRCMFSGFPKIFDFFEGQIFKPM